MLFNKAGCESHGPIRAQETRTQRAWQRWQWSQKCRNMGQRGKPQTNWTKEHVRANKWKASSNRRTHTDRQPDESYDRNDWMPIIWLGVYEIKCQWCLARMVMVKMYLADHRRGPVGDYQGLASFNLAPPPHQATRVPFYCCTANNSIRVFFCKLYFCCKNQG